MQIFTAQSFSQRQSFVVSAQLQQAICLLQMANPDLQSYIERQAEENPFIEFAPPRGSSSSLQRSQSGADWDRVAGLAAEPGPSLYVHVTAEIARLGLNDRDAAVAVHFVDALEPTGWVAITAAAVAARASTTPDHAEAVLARLQRIEPAGLFARSLAECLRLQAAAEGLLTPLFAAVLDNLPLLAAADLRGLARVCGCTQDDLRQVLRRLRSLDPKPGAQFDAAPTPQRPPDLLVTRGQDGWKVDLNRSTLPTVVVRADDARRTARQIREPAQTREPARHWIGERLSVARWLVRAVDHRNQTTLKIGVEVVRRQAEFLERGPAHLRPMTLREVADAIGMHESTVSRVTSGMMMGTPQGALPLKAFFSAALSGSDGDMTGSAAAVRHRIRALVAAESPQNPLSDDAIVHIMAGEGVVLARRTVAKYRDVLNIPSSVQRRRQARVAGA